MSEPRPSEDESEYQPNDSVRDTEENEHPTDIGPRFLSELYKDDSCD